MPKLTLPLSELSEADPAWLSSVLEGSGALKQGRVELVTHEPWQKTISSIIGRLRVVYSVDARSINGTTPPVALVLKLSKPTGSGKRISTLGHREFEFYSKIAQSMDRPPVPHCYDAAYDPESGKYHFLMEDLSGTHYHPMRNPLPPSESECEQIMACLARIHAAWWDDPRPGRDFGRPYSEERWSKRAAHVGKRTEQFLAMLGDRISGTRAKVLRDMNTVYRQLTTHQREGHLTITHGDAHFQNILIAAEGTDCRMIDWEDWELAPATDDLASMIAVLWFPERRKRLEQNLLRRYHDTLLKSGVQDYPWETFWNDYRLSVIKALCKPIYQWVNGIKAAQWWNNLERSLMSYEDLDCAELMEQLMVAHGSG